MDWLKKLFGLGTREKESKTNERTSNEDSDQTKDEREPYIPFSPPSRMKPEDIKWTLSDDPINHNCNLD
jgi:hypothetical protein